MLLMCLSVLACLVALKAWQVYMMTCRTDDWLKIAEAEHRRRVILGEKIGDRGKVTLGKIREWMAK